MVMKFKNIDDKHRYYRKAQKIMLFTSGIMVIIPFFLFILQLVRGIFSIWNLIPVIIAVFIGFGAIKITFSGNKKKDQGLYYSENVESKEDKLIREDKERYAGVLLDVVSPLSKKSKMLRLFFSVFLIITGCCLFTIAPIQAKSDANLISVNARVVSQVDKTTYEYSKDSDGETTITEKRACDLTITFNFDKKEKTQTIRLEGISYVYSENIDIYLDSSGKFVKSVASTQTFSWVGGVFILTGILLIVSLYFSISDIVFVPTFMLLIGGSLAFILGLKISFVDMLVSDFTTFFSLFVSIALYMFLSLILIAAQFPKNITEIVDFEKSRPNRNPRLQQDYAHRNIENGTSYQIPNPPKSYQKINKYKTKTRRKLKEGEQVVIGRVETNLHKDKKE